MTCGEIRESLSTPRVVRMLLLVVVVLVVPDRFTGPPDTYRPGQFFCYRDRIDATPCFLRARKAAK